MAVMRQHFCRLFDADYWILHWILRLVLALLGECEGATEWNEYVKKAKQQTIWRCFDLGQK